MSRRLLAGAAAALAALAITAAALLSGLLPGAAPAATPTPPATVAAVSPPSPSATLTATKPAPVASPVPGPPATPLAANPTAFATPPVDEWLAERPRRDLADLAARFRDMPGAPTPQPLLRGTPVVGDRRAFWVMDQSRVGMVSVSARLAAISQFAYFYVAEDLAVGDSAVRQTTVEFDRSIFPAVTRLFGPVPVPGVDGDPRMIVLLVRLSAVSGYHSSADLYHRAAHPFSNEAEMIYVTGATSLVGTPGYGALLAHELQHLARGDAPPPADNWIDEGSSNLAVRLLGFPSAGLAQAFLSNPDTQLNHWADSANRAAAHYGAAYLFMSYFVERYGVEALAGLRASVGRGADLFDNYLARTGHTERFDDVFADWTVANFLDQPSLLDGRYGYRDLDTAIRSLSRLGTGSTTSDTVRQYAARYYALPALARESTLVFQGERAASLLPAEARSGARFWWGNRGDLMDARLTRELDLTSVRAASLRFWTWYDLEESFDYAYVAVSTDGGRRWQTLPGRRTRSDNPVGNNLGHGFTGRSGGGASPTWVEEVISLDAYAGRQILLRFEYVTDDGYNSRGFAVDDIAVPEIGFYDGAEADAGWRSEGFVRSDNRVPQRYALRLLRPGSEEAVQTVALDGDNAARISLPALSQGEQLTLVVAAMAPLSVEPAAYTLYLQPAARP